MESIISKLLKMKPKSESAAPAPILPAVPVPEATTQNQPAIPEENANYAQDTNQDTPQLKRIRKVLEEMRGKTAPNTLT